MSRGGFTRVMNKVDTAAFTYSWSMYKSGFGTITGNYWAGFDNMRLILNNQKMTIRFEYYTDPSIKYYFQMKDMSLGPESDYYRITYGNLTESNVSPPDIAYHNNTPFSTYDFGPVSGCATSWSAGWWYNNCYNFCYTCSSSYTYIKILLRP